MDNDTSLYLKIIYVIFLLNFLSIIFSLIRGIVKTAPLKNSFWIEEVFFAFSVKKFLNTIFSHFL